VLRQIGQPEDAMAEFERTLQHDPASAEAWISIGQMRQRQRDADGAAAAFARADAIRKAKADAQSALFAIKAGMQKLEADDLPAAIAQLQEAVRLNPGNPQAHFQLARALARSGAPDEARQHMDEARRLAPALVPPDAK
jgi:tetratricopeptide (TPR) repeat protein